MALGSISKLLHMDNQDVRHVSYEMLEILVFPFAGVALHFDCLSLAMQLDARLKLYELLLSGLLDVS